MTILHAVRESSPNKCFYTLAFLQIRSCLIQ